MADNVTVQVDSVGTTALVSSDDIGAGVQAQNVKLLDGTGGSATPIAAGGGVEAGALRVTVASDSTGVLSVDDNGGSLTVDGTFWQTTQPVSIAGTVSVSNGGTFAVQVTSVPSDPFGANADAASATGSISAKLRFIASTGIPITGTVTVGSHAVTNAGTFAVQAAQSGTWNVVCAGDVAHDGADSGNPVKTGGRAMTTARTAVSDGDRADHAVDVQGRTIVEPFGPRELMTDASITLTSTTTETTLLTAVASTFCDLLGIIVVNSSASATQVDIRDTMGGTVRFSLYVPAGATVGFSNQMWKQATVNTNWTAKCGTSVASVVVSAVFRKTK